MEGVKCNQAIEQCLCPRSDTMNITRSHCPISDSSWLKIFFNRNQGNKTMVYIIFTYKLYKKYLHPNTILYLHPTYSFGIYVINILNYICNLETYNINTC